MLERYTILHELGRGATGAVYAARDRTTGAVVALKRLDPAKSARPSPRLKHPNIVGILDAGEAGGTTFVVMEMLEGESLRKLLDAGPLPIARAIRIVHDVASGLAHAHLQGVVHGALQASKIIVLRSGVAKITDFRGEPLDHRCDILALGALFYEMLTRRPPAEGGPVPPPSEVNPRVPRALDAIVLSMLAPQPAERMPGVPVLLRELQRLEEELGLASGANAPADEPAAGAPPERPEPALRPIDHEAFARHRAMMERDSRRERPSGFGRIFAALALVLAVAGLGYGGFMYYSSLPSESPAASVPAAPPPVAAAAKDEPVAASGAWKPAPPHALDPAPAEEAPVKARAEVRPIAPAPVAAPIKEPVAEHASPGTLLGLKLAPAKPAVEESEPLRAPPPAPLPKPKAMAKAPEPQPAGTAQLVLAVSPRGELYVDGEHQGATPPTTTFDLEPGMHRIEVRSGSRKPFLTYMTVQAGEVRRIRHDFDARPSRPPS